MSELNRYNDWLSSGADAWESLCHNCGACCGAYEDPCEHLHRDPSGKYFCDIYISRFGEQRTVSGAKARCVPIREKIGQTWPGDERCGYKKALKGL